MSCSLIERDEAQKVSGGILHPTRNFFCLKIIENKFGGSDYFTYLCPIPKNISYEEVIQTYTQSDTPYIMVVSIPPPNKGTGINVFKPGIARHPTEWIVPRGTSLRKNFG